MAGNTTRSEANQSFFVYVKDTKTGTIKRVAIPADVQIGLEGQPSELQLFGRFSVNTTPFVIDQANKGTINVSNNDTVVAVTMIVPPNGERIKVHLPPDPRDGQLHFIKDMSGTAADIPIDIIPPTGLKIDNSVTKTLSDNYGSLALIWFGGEWRMLVAGLGGSGGSGAPATASYVTISPEPGLSAERHLTGSANISVTDNGPKSTVVLDLTQLIVSPSTFTYATVTVDRFGRITAISNGTPPPPNGASYITALAEGGLPNDRVLTGSLGIKVVDNGAGTNVALSIDPTFFIAGPGIVLSTGTLGHNLTISTSTPGDFDPWIDLGPGGIYTTSSVAITGSLNITQNLTITGSALALGGLTGSLQRVPSGNPYLVGIGGTVVTTNSLGQVIISSSAGTGGTLTNVSGVGGTSASIVGSLAIVSSSIYADRFASYLIASASAQSPNARILAPGTGISLLDNGPGNTLVISTSGSGGGGSLPTPKEVGDVLFATTAAAFVSAMPITTTGSGWLVNNSGYLMVATH